MMAILILGALSMLGAGIALVRSGRRTKGAPATRNTAIGIITIVLGGFVLFMLGLWYAAASIGPIWGP